MKKVLIFARDPGGANAVIPLISIMLKRYEVVVYAKQFALKRMKAEQIKCFDIENEITVFNERNIVDFLKTISPDILITGTSLDDYTERFLWKAANILGISSFAIIDQWMNLGIRFSKYDYTQIDIYKITHEHSFMPDKIFVMDDLAKEIIAKEGIPESKILVSGQPHFDVIRRKYSKAEVDNKDADKINIVYVSEPIIQDYDGGDENKLYLGYNERTTFENLYIALSNVLNQSSKKARLIVRPHPRECVKDWKNIIASKTNKKIILECDTQNDSFYIMKKADLVCGMSSMFLIEAAICEIPIISIQIGLKQDTPFILDKIDRVKSKLTYNELETDLKNTIMGNYNKCDFNIKKHAADNVIRYIEEECSYE